MSARIIPPYLLRLFFICNRSAPPESATDCTNLHEKSKKFVKIRVIRGKKELEAGVSRMAPERLPSFNYKDTKTQSVQTDSRMPWAKRSKLGMVHFAVAVVLE